MRDDKLSKSEKFFFILLPILSRTFCQPDILLFVISGYSNSEKNSASKQRSNPFSISSSSKTVFLWLFLFRLPFDASSSEIFTAFLALSLLISLSTNANSS